MKKRLFCLLGHILLLQIGAFSQKDTTKFRKTLIFPIITSSIETGWSFGSIAALIFKPNRLDTISRTSNLEILGLYTTKKQLVTAINGSQYFDEERYILNEQVSYSSFPDKFWGIGPNSQETDMEAYKFHQYYIYLHGLRKLTNHLFIGLIFEIQKVMDITYDVGGLFDQQKIVGRNGYGIAGVGTSFTFDSRDNAFSPDKGFFGQLFLNHFDKFWGSDYNYNSIILDLRKYCTIGKEKVLAFQMYSLNTTGNEVPIRSLASFGGSNRMRGYYDGRYKDNNMFILQTEYRFPIYKWLKGVAFGGAGTVGRDINTYALENIKSSFGGGLRIALSKKEKLNLRIDYGIGQGKDNGLYLQLGEAF